MAVFKNGIFYPEAGNFIVAAGLTDETQMKAINKLVWDLKVFNVWDKMKAIYPFVGQAGVSSSYQFNLKDPNTFKGTFFGSWTFANTGVKGVSLAHMNTGFNPSTNLAQNSSHISFYSRTNTSGSTDFGAFDTVGLRVYVKYDATNSLLATANSSTSITQTNDDSRGYVVINRKSSSQVGIVVNGITTNYTNTSTGLPNLNLFLNALNYLGNPIDYGNKECAFASIGDGLTDTEAANLYTAVQRFQTTLGRQV
jgi:hypothetical protein